MLKNYMEDVIDEYLPHLIKQYPDICTCQMCTEDIKAIALNHLTPTYFVTRQGLLYSKIEEMTFQYKADLANELTKAIEIVSNNPRHD